MEKNCLLCHLGLPKTIRDASALEGSTCKALVWLSIQVGTAALDRFDGRRFEQPLVTLSGFGKTVTTDGLCVS
ncbi:MAG: hypothetical protein CMJ50_07700 [Planctomycetaceae bacterium]|jgi:hypothetical protein|nr:hypothetical protein [Planctomycetaceae bacterium]